MRYKSTRGYSETASAAEAIIEGIAPDGGLYVPTDTVLPFKLDQLPTADYRELARTIFTPFLAGFDSGELNDAVNKAYSPAKFNHPAVTPLHILDEKLSVLELWHGPTAAFKDIALQLLPYLMRLAIRQSGEEKEIVILTATSGDTGKSALEGFKNIPGIKIIVYYPETGVSEIQKLQMTTQEGRNVAVAAVKGNFDDAQNGVKALFNDSQLAATLAGAGKRLSSANSINWGRLLPQIVYYFAAYLELVKRGLHSGEKVNFVVPTGNFGNILAGYYAYRLGLPINRLICAANRNNVLSDFIGSGTYNCHRPLHQTLSPSMDILISSNLERLLFELSNQDPELVNSWMEKLKQKGEYTVNEAVHQKIRELFWSGYADDQKTSATIADVYGQHNYLIDTHTAVGRAVLGEYWEQEGDGRPVVILSTASPYKFTGSVTRAIMGNRFNHNLSETELIKVLSVETGTTVPANLTGLEEKAIKHKQVIATSAMRDHLLEVLGIS
jgi:threonine synthase